MKMGNVSFGGTAAIGTSVALIFGLHAATATQSTIVSGRLLVALTWALARERRAGFMFGLGKHCAAALAVILASRGVGALITAQFP